MRIERELMRGPGPLAVLGILQRGQMYGYELVEALRQRNDRVLAKGQSTLYPLLYNLEAQGLIEATWRDTTAGRQRKYYHLTGKGKKRLSTKAERLGFLSAALAALDVLNPAPSPAAGRA